MIQVIHIIMVPSSSSHQAGLPSQQALLDVQRHHSSTASSAEPQPPNEALKLQKLSRERERQGARGYCQLALAEATAPGKEPPALDGLPRTGTMRRWPTSRWLHAGKVGRAYASRNTSALQTGAWLPF